MVSNEILRILNARISALEGVLMAKDIVKEEELEKVFMAAFNALLEKERNHAKEKDENDRTT